MTKLPLYEDEPRLSRFVDGLIAEMKQASFLYSDHLYATAKDVFISEQLDSDPESIGFDPPSKGMLAVLFYTTLQAGWENEVDELLDSFVGVALIGDVRGYYTQAAPINDKGYKYILCDANNDPVAAFGEAEAIRFREHVSELNRRLSISHP